MKEILKEMLKEMLKEIPQTLIGYIEGEILPLYDNADAAHNIDHINYVIGQALKLSQYYPVNAAILYVAAAYHDIGVRVSRATHHIESAKAVRKDENLRVWFSEDEIEVIANAVEDHRASSESEPRGIYGKILAEADRGIEKESIFRRTIQFGLSKYPELNRAASFERAYGHLQEKYAEGGYMKLWIPESDNAQGLKELRSIISDRKSARIFFDKLYREEFFAPYIKESFKCDDHYRNWYIGVLAPKPGTVVLGVLAPELKRLGKLFSKRPDRLEIISDWEESYPDSPLSHEERMVWGFLINYADFTIQERLHYAKSYCKVIDNWALCDFFCSHSKWIKKAFKRGETELIQNFIQELLSSSGEFTRRVGVVLLMTHFLDENNCHYTFDSLKKMELSDNEPYYLQMGVAWLLATALYKREEATLDFLSKTKLPDSILKLFRRKARESLRKKVRAHVL